MSLQTQHLPFLASRKAQRAAVLLARQERIPVWALPRLFIGIIGLGFFFTFFDIGDINVSFIQTCTQIVPGCLPQTANHYLGICQNSEHDEQCPQKVGNVSCKTSDRWGKHKHMRAVLGEKWGNLSSIL